MTDDSILKQVVKGLGQIGTETVEKAAEHAGAMASSIITGKQLLGDITPMTDQELAQRKAEEDRKKEEEMAKLRQQMREPGRNVEAEMKQEERKMEEEEQKKLREEQEKIKAQQQEMNSASVEMESGNPHKRKKKRGSAFAQGKKKTNQPDPASMSQTSEKAGKME